MNNLEIERKFLLDVNNIPYDFSKLTKSSIEQGYIIYKPEIRVRSISDKDYFLTIKGDTKEPVQRDEIEFRISKEAYLTLMSRDDINKITKNRYVVNEENNVYQIDVFEGELKGLACMEVEFNSREEAERFVAPEWAVKEITNDHRYRNSFLARNKIPSDN